MRKLHPIQYRKHRKQLILYTLLLSLVFALFVYRELEMIVIEKIEQGRHIKFRTDDVSMDLAEIKDACLTRPELFLPCNITYLIADQILL